MCKSEDGSAASPVLLPYLPKQSLKWLVDTEGNSKHGWRKAQSYKYRSTLLSEIGKYASQHGAPAVARGFSRKLEKQGI